MLPKLNSLIWVLPVAGGLYSMSKANNKAQRNVSIAVAGAGLLGYLLSNKSSTVTDDQIYTDVPTFPPSQSDQLLIQSVLSDLTNNLLSWFSFSDRCNALKRYYEVSENNFKIIANEFKNQNGRTIKGAISDLYTDGCGPFSEEYSELVVDRINQLNIP